MSKDHEGDIKSFILSHKAWYAPYQPDNLDRNPQIMIGFYSPEGGTSGEFTMRWKIIGGTLTPQLQVFSDAWHALSEMPELIHWMADHDDEDITPEQVEAALIELGYTDRTAYERD